MELNQQMIEAARRGGTELDRLLAQVWPEAYRVAYGILHDRGLAEDAAQDACALISRKLPTLKNSAAFRTWMYKIVANRAISIGRARKATHNLEAASEHPVNADPTERIDLYRALAVLPLRQRAAVLLHYYAGLNSSEISDACGFPPGSVRFYLMQARRALRKALVTDATIARELSSKEASHGC
jgi:RNA polymerase sigma-70 factor, ECF subfamily